MPRKVQPRWDAWGVEKVPDFKLSADQLAALAGILEIDSPLTIAKLKSELESIGAYYPVWLQQDEKGPSWAEQNAALKKLLVSPEPKLTLSRLDYATQGRVLDELWTHRCPRSGEVVENLLEVTDDTLEHVLHCAKLALAEGQKRRGPPTPKTLPLVIGRLAKVYEETTGERLRHTPYAKTKYKGTPQSKAGRFMAAFLKIVDPRLPETSIATELARFVARRNKAQEDSRVQTF
jgi:hypothetical protein